MDHQWRVEAVDHWSMTPDSGGPRTTDEPLGTKEKFWVRAPDGNRYLFKYARVRQGRTMGEDWVEWVVHKLATLLSIPTATAIPALHDGRRGVLSLSVLAPGDRLIHGNELLARSDPEYDSLIQRQNPRYTIEAVLKALSGISAPVFFRQPPISTAFDMWAGYLMLDAWVAGRDRHHENWAAIEHAGTLRLAPSFDHGNALGFQEPEAKAQTLTEDDLAVKRWAERGRSHHFSGKPSLIYLASTALDLAGHDVREHWLNALRNVADDDIESVLAAVPPAYMSELGRTFRVKLLRLNRERILHGD